MKIITNIDEYVTFGLLEMCIERLNKDNTSSANKNERLNKLKKIRDNYIDTMTEKFLSEKIT